MGLYPLDQNYGLSTWYENTGADDLWAGTDLLLDLSRRILESDAYIFQGMAFPRGNDIFIAPGQTFSGALNLTPFSYVVSVTGWSGNENRFTVRIYDKGAQTDVYARQFGWFPAVVSNMTQTNNGIFVPQGWQNVPFGPYFFRDPLVILPPGVLQIQITNVSPVDFPLQAAVQMFFNVAVPKNTISLNTRKVQTASDPTGTQTLQGKSGISALDVLRQLL